MKNNRKRLNNKGFTLIELLAVVVILAVVMGIAMTSVLSSMNNSRMGSLQNSAKKVSQAIQAKYSEAMVTGSVKNVYGDVLGSTTTEEGDVVGNGFDFSGSGVVFYTLPDGLKDEMNLSPSTYELISGNVATKISVNDNKATATDSFVGFDGSKVIVCLFAKQGGSYYVGGATKTGGTVDFSGVTITMQTAESTADMWACSTDGTQSWE